MSFRLRRGIVTVVSLIGLFIIMVAFAPHSPTQPAQAPVASASPASKGLEGLPIKGRAPTTGYARTQFGNGWATKNDCDTRETILNRDLTNVTLNDKCQVVSGVLNDPYTGKTITFNRSSNASAIQIDHVVALGDAWQTGAQQLTPDQRKALANDPLELLAVDGQANQQKSDGDAATWLPSNKGFRCEYVARQIAVKQKYSLWVTQAEHDAIAHILASCPQQTLPTP